MKPRWKQDHLYSLTAVNSGSLSYTRHVETSKLTYIFHIITIQRHVESEWQRPALQLFPVFSEQQQN